MLWHVDLSWVTLLKKTDSSWSNEILCVHSFPVLKILCVLTLCKSFVNCQNYCNFIAATAMLFLENKVSLILYSSSYSWNLSTFYCINIPEPWVEGCHIYVLLMTKLTIFSYSMHYNQFEVYWSLGDSLQVEERLKEKAAA